MPPRPSPTRSTPFSPSRVCGRGSGGGSRHRTILAFLCLLAFALPALAALTFPPLTGRVVDQANLLPEPDRAALTDALAALEAKTTDQLVIVTLTSLQGTSIEEYGYQLGRNWGIGQKGRNNGALLIVVPSERRVRIEVGYGLEGTLTDAATRVIIESAILPRFRAGDFPGGIRAGAAQLIQLLTGEAAAIADAGTPAPVAAPEEQAWPVILIVLGVIGFLIVCAALGGGICGFILRMLLWAAISGRSNSSGGSGGSSSSFSGGGGSFGGGGSSGRW